MRRRPRHPPTAPCAGLLVRLATAAGMLAAGAGAGQSDATRLDRLLAAYPEHLERIEGGTLVWRDGSRMPVDDGRGTKSFEQWLADPDIEDMLAKRYPMGPLAAPPGREDDPGRARNGAFFARMYGDCRKGEVAAHLVDIIWLPRKAGQRLAVTRINGVADKLRAVSAELDRLPARFDGYLAPAAGAYTCRTIAGTSRLSAHGYGIAIDIALPRSDYWRWSRPAADGSYPYRNRIPPEVVEVFERHGFIWGGKWHHYDTMHFEYRPELIERR